MRAAGCLWLSGILLTMISQPSVSEGSIAALESVEEMRWRHRVILVQSDQSCDGEIKTLQEANDEITDRHILWFVFCGEIVETNFSGNLSEDFARNTKSKYFSGSSSEAVLIGKDGGVKNRAQSLDLLALNQQIDTMPMRQREMREKLRGDNS